MLWPANRLPVPAGATIRIEVEEKAVQVVDENDNFPKGEIIRYFPNQGHGFIKDKAGNEVFFNLDEMNITGQKDRGAIEVGVKVGYDIARSGRDLHVKTMKIY